MLDTSNLDRGPFNVNEIENEVEALVKGPHDPIRDRPRKVSTGVGAQLGSDLGGPAPRPQDPPAIVSEDAVNPSHYRKHPSGIECIEVARHMNFNIGNATKYLWRYMDKGDPIENLQKAQWYIDDEIRRLQGLR